jgi:hypothetical protein
MIKRNKIIMIASLGITTLICAFVGWLMISAAMERKSAYDERNNSFAALNKIYNAKIFPCTENIERIKANQKEVEGWLLNASNLLHKGDLPLEQLTPTAFKQSLQAVVRKLSRQPGAKNGKVVVPGFQFGFDQYLGESDSLPSPVHVPRLTSQLRIIENICKELYAANILSIEAISREVFESTEKKAETRPRASSRRDRNKRRSSKKKSSSRAPIADQSSLIEYFEKQRFTFEFVATPAAFVEALNKLASMDMFVVVAETSFIKTGDQLQLLMVGAGKKKDEDGVKKDPASMSHVERMITNPDIDPPVRVTLALDVFSFKGV